MKCSMTGQEKRDLLIQVTSWTGLIVLSTSDIFFSVLFNINIFGQCKHPYKSCDISKVDCLSWEKYLPSSEMEVVDINIMFQKENVILYYNTLINYTVYRGISVGCTILAYFGLVRTSLSAKIKNSPY